VAFDTTLRDNGAFPFDGSLSAAEPQTIIVGDAADALSAALDPVLLAVIVLTPDVADVTSASSDPTLVPGEVVLTPGSAEATSGAFDPTLVTGPVTLTLADTATGTTQALDPTYTAFVILAVEDVAAVVSSVFSPTVDAVVRYQLSIEVDITDATYGVDFDECTFVINGETVSPEKDIIPNGVHLRYHPPNNFDYGEPIRVIVHAVNGNLAAPVVKDVPYTLYYGYKLTYLNNDAFEYDSPVNVFVSARNRKENYKYLNDSYSFTSYKHPFSNLTAQLDAINPISNLGASITSVAPEHRYGETVTVELFVKDFNGNELGPYTFTYTIENKPS